ncbi:MAG: tRNA-specific adenosine deaminase [Desulfobacteraceae bacterium IS3]|nr:MAG: tRNA-specific adenosine deaminase [Desulfobacteraceae bacterium IS3]
MDHKYFMQKALEQARIALRKGEFPVGCVLVYKNRIIAASSRANSTGAAVNEIDHAEILALRQLGNLERKIDRGKITLFSTLEPCLMCFGAIMLSGIGEIVYAYEDVMGGGTLCDLSVFTPLYRNHQIPIISNILRKESLELFKIFFSNPENTYWKDSLLAKYSLSQ